MTASTTTEALASIDAGQVVHNGRLVLKFNQHTQGFVQASINEERLVPIVLKCLLEAFPVDALNFLDVVSTSNGGDFPLKKLTRALEKELKPYSGKIRFVGKGLFEGDRLLNYKRS